MRLSANKKPQTFQNSPSGKGNTAQLPQKPQDSLNQMLASGKISPEDYAKIVQNRK